VDAIVNNRHTIWTVSFRHSVDVDPVLPSSTIRKDIEKRTPAGQWCQPLEPYGVCHRDRISILYSCRSRLEYNQYGSRYSRRPKQLKYHKPLGTVFNQTIFWQRMQWCNAVCRLNIGEGCWILILWQHRLEIAFFWALNRWQCLCCNYGSVYLTKVSCK